MCAVSYEWRGGGECVKCSGEYLAEDTKVADNWRELQFVE